MTRIAKQDFRFNPDMSLGNFRIDLLVADLSFAFVCQICNFYKNTNNNKNAFGQMPTARFEIEVETQFDSKMTLTLRWL